jgi:hypothetical protein
LPQANRSSHHASRSHAMSANVLSPSRARAFGDPNRRLSPPTSRTPVTPSRQAVVDTPPVLTGGCPRKTPRSRQAQNSRFRRLTSIDAWLTTARDAFARSSGLVPGDLTVDEHTAATVLALARIAAHMSGQRTNAPLLSYLAGLAVARGASIDDLAEALRGPGDRSPS